MGHKTLHESAAEILAASVANAGREPLPMAAMMNPPADLGGEMASGDVVSPGAATAQQVMPAEKPGQAGAPAEAIKQLPVEGEEAEEKEESEEGEEEQKDPNKLMESLIAEHGAEMILENLITEYGDHQIFTLIMEEYVSEYGEDLVSEKFGETLVEQYGEEAVAQFIVENVVAEFHEQEFTDEEFQSLSESSEAFITEMQTLSEEEFDDYIANLSEEEFVAAIQLSSLNEEYLVEFLKKIKKAVKKGVKAVGKVAKKIIRHPLFSTVASFALPGVGTALGALGGKLASTAVGKAVGAVGSKLASSALGKGVAALGKTAIGKVVKGVAGDAIKSGIGSKLQGGSFSQGAKAGALGSVTGMAGNALGRGISNLTGSQAAGDLASNVAQAKLSGGSGTKATVDTLTRGSDEGQETAADDQEERVAAAPPPAQRTQVRQAAAQDDNEADYADSWRIRRGPQRRQVAEEAEELLNHLSSLNEEQLSSFVDQLSDEDVTLIADILEENAIVTAGNRILRGPKATKLTPKEKAGATTVRNTNTARNAALGGAALVGGLGTDMNWARNPSSSTTAADAKKKKDAAKAAVELMRRQDQQKILTGKEQSIFDKTPDAGPTIQRDIELGKEKMMTDAQRKAKGVMDLYNRQTKNYIYTGDYNKPPIIDLSDTEKSRRENPDAWRTQGGFGPQDRGTQTTTNVTPGPAPRPDSNRPAGDNDWDYMDTWHANPINRAGGGGSSSVAVNSGRDAVDAAGPINNAPKEKTYGDQVVDQIKRTGRAAIRTGIGGAILGQDWKDAAQAGATGQVVGDAWKAFSKGWKDQQRKQQGMNESIEELHMNGEETTMETTELTEEQIREERMLAIKEAVKQFKGHMREDVDALFNGESLSEEFRAKATLIFESAVTSRVETILEQVMEQNDQVLSEAYDEIRDSLTEQVDEYLNYVVEQWMEQNQVAIETGLRAELAEDFISGLRSLFQEHYIEIPEEKVDVAETLAAELDQAAEYVEGVHEYVAGQEETIADLQEQLNAVKKAIVTESFCSGLTAVQAGKMKALAEGVEFTTEGDFEEKLAVLRENYFPAKVQVRSEVKELQQVALNEEPEVEQTNSIMNRYVQSISKTAAKA